MGRTQVQHGAALRARKGRFRVTFMRAILVVVMALSIGCGEQAVSGPDAGAVELTTCAENLCRPVGSSCSPSGSALCAGGTGWCSGNVCRQFCAAASYPRCPSGDVEQHAKVAGADVCVCVPD
jgi:hypothetical protein